MVRKITFNFFTNLPPNERKITLSTWVTLIRIFLTPCIVAAMIVQQWGLAFLLFSTASITDIIDGALARWLNERTFLGAALDPVADKFLILSCFFTLAFAQSPLFTIPYWFVTLVLIKELIIILGAVALYMIKGDLEIKPTLLGKMTTLFQIIFIQWLFACYFFNWVPIKTYYVMLTLMVMLILCSLLQYMRVGYEQYKQS